MLSLTYHCIPPFHHRNVVVRLSVFIHTHTHTHTAKPFGKEAKGGVCQKDEGQGNSGREIFANECQAPGTPPYNPILTTSQQSIQ